MNSYKNSMTTHNDRPQFAMVVNDTPTQLAMLAGKLRKAGIEPRMFDGAEAALAVLDGEHPPSLIITDLYMPGIDGWRFCRLLRSPEYAAFNRVPILVVSATFSGDDAARIATDLGAEAFIPSELDGNRFCQQVRAALNGERLPIPPRILIVDDDEALCDLLKKLFSIHGYEVETALTLRAASEAFRKNVFDVALLDYHLSDGFGDVLLDEFRALRPDCVCLMITSDTDTNLVVEWMRKGAAAYLAKPFQSAYLIELCARARRERALLRVQDLLELRTRELRQSEESALRNNALLRSIMESPLDIIIYALDTHYRYTMFAQAHKRAMKAIWGTDIEVGMNMLDAITNSADREKARKNFDRALQGEHFIAMEEYGDPALLRTVFKDRYNPIIGDGGVVSGLTVFVNDITERMRAEAEKAQLEVRLQQAEKMESVGRLAGGVAHDFNNMLQVIMGNADLALDGIPPNSTIRKRLEEIQNSAQHAADTTRQLLGFARQQTIMPKVLDFNETLEGLLKLMRRLIGEDIDLIWKPAAGLGPVKVDPTQINQILTNLCVNARDAIAGVGEITIETGGEVFDQTDCAENPGIVPGDYVLLAVNDNGCGMDKKTQALIFEPFFTTKDVGKGTGLGLATVYGIVKQNDGFITVYSEPGRGTTFKIYLPRHTGKSAASRTESVAPPPKSCGETVLLVEDDLAILSSTQKILNRLGYTVLTASTPSEAIRLAEARAEGIHLLITDVVMPDMNGLDLSKRLLSRNPKLKCLFMSGHTAGVIADHGVLNEGVRFVQKPFTTKDLASKIRKTLDQ